MELPLYPNPSLGWESGPFPGGRRTARGPGTSPLPPSGVGGHARQVSRWVPPLCAFLLPFFLFFFLSKPGASALRCVKNKISCLGVALQLLCHNSLEPLSGGQEFPGSEAGCCGARLGPATGGGQGKVTWGAAGLAPQLARHPNACCSQGVGVFFPTLFACRWGERCAKGTRQHRWMLWGRE